MITKLFVTTVAAICVFTAAPAFGQTASDYMQQAIVQFKAQNHKEAERLFGECIRVEPRNLECLYRRGIVRELYIGYGLALNDYNTALTIAPTSSILLTARGALYYSMKRPAEAIVDLNKAIEAQPTQSKAYFYRGHINREKGDTVQAISDYTMTVALDPKNDIAYMFRAGIYKVKGDIARALADYTSAIVASPQNGGHYTRRGEIYFGQGKTDLAEADFKKAVELDPGQKSMISTIKILAQLERSAKAEAARPKTPLEEANSAGYDHMSKKQWDLAIADFTKAIQLAPNSYWGYIYRNRAYVGKGEYEKALTDLTKGMALAGTSASGFELERAELYFLQGKNAVALTEVNRIIAAEKQPDAYSRFLRGKIHAKMGSTALARADLEKAIQLNSYLKGAKDELAKLK